jgi:hypothetical protein
LSPKALEHLGRRARAWFHSPFPGDVLDGDDPFRAARALTSRFLAWAASAPPDKLVTGLRTLSTDGSGGRWVKGRNRGDGMRSAPQFEWPSWAWCVQYRRPRLKAVGVARTHAMSL